MVGSIKDVLLHTEDVQNSKYVGRGTHEMQSRIESIINHQKME